nr:replication protein A 70 kDa DNA-binding subunit B [Tanacetum cinerariifolium]
MRKNKESSFTNHFSLSNKPIATFVSGYISDLSPVKDNIKLRVRILRAWLQPLYNNQQVKNMEMIVMDEHNTKMQATVRMDKLKRFQHHLKEGNALTIQRYSLDVVGQVIACEDLDNYDKNGKAEKKPVTLIDYEGNEIKCTLWGDYAQLFNDFLNSCDDHGMIVLGVQSIIVGNVIAIQKDEGWWYLGCRACHGKVIKSTDYIDLESEMPKKPDGPNYWWFRLQIHVQDETGTTSLSLFNDEVQAMSKSDGFIPTEITNLIGNKYAFKVSIDDYNVKKLLPVFTVLRFSNDQEIINSVLACVTPIKKTNKRPAEGETGRESSTGKKKAVEIKVEKDA